MKKGIELPMNTLVVVSIAVLILLAMIAFFMTSFKEPSSSQAKYSKLLAECQKWTASGGCDETDISNVDESLKEAYCEWKGGKWKNNKCDVNIEIDDLKSVCCVVPNNHQESHPITKNTEGGKK